MGYQTSVQKQKSLRVGSVKVEVGASVGALVNLGVGAKAKMAEKWTEFIQKFDNAPPADPVVVDQECTFSMEMNEIDPVNLSSLRGGIDMLTTTPASPVTVTGENKGTGWTIGNPIKLNNKNGAGTIVTAITVKGAGTGLVAGTDYRTYVGDGSNGEKGASYIVPLTAQAGIITVDYTYTPNAAVTMTTGGKFTISPNVVRVTNTNAAGKVFRLTFFKAYNSKGIDISFGADDDGKVWALPIELKGIRDVDRDPGAQLYELYDEQSA